MFVLLLHHILALYPERKGGREGGREGGRGERENKRTKDKSRICIIAKGDTLNKRKSLIHTGSVAYSVCT